jgi:hypothetical protein
MYRGTFIRKAGTPPYEHKSSVCVSCGRTRKELAFMSKIDPFLKNMLI